LDRLPGLAIRLGVNELVAKQTEGGSCEAALLEHRPLRKRQSHWLKSSRLREAAVPLVFGLFAVATFPLGRRLTEMQIQGQNRSRVPDPELI